jgi:hypothetical protein
LELQPLTPCPDAAEEASVITVLAVYF